MSRIGDIAIGVIIGIGGLIGAALAWDKYGSSENSNNHNADDTNDKEVNVDNVDAEDNGRGEEEHGDAQNDINIQNDQDENPNTSLS